MLVPALAVLRRESEPECVTHAEFWVDPVWPYKVGLIQMSEETKMKRAKLIIMTLIKCTV